MYSRFTPTCFGKWLPSSGDRRCLRSYSSNICFVGVYGLRSVQCDQLSWNGYSTTTGHTGRIIIQEISVLWVYTDYDPSSVASCRGMDIPRQLATLDGS